MTVSPWGSAYILQDTKDYVLFFQLPDRTKDCLYNRHTVSVHPCTYIEIKVWLESMCAWSLYVQKTLILSSCLGNTYYNMFPLGQFNLHLLHNINIINSKDYWFLYLYVYHIYITLDRKIKFLCFLRVKVLFWC